MATKKVAAKKKAPVKKTTTRTKRKYTRRAKPEVVEQTPADKQMTDKAPEDAMADSHGGSVESNLSILSQIEVIDMRGLDNRQKFGVLGLLDNEGYLLSSLDSMVGDINALLDCMVAEALILNNVNRLITLGNWGAAKEYSAISRPYVLTHSNVSFSRPQPTYPDAVTIDGAQYIRVG